MISVFIFFKRRSFFGLTFLIFQIGFSQNQLPIINGDFETIDSETNSSFLYWSNVQNNGGNANYSIETQNLIPGSTKAQKSEIIELGENGYDVKTNCDYLFRVELGKSYIVRFWAKIEGSNSAQMKVVFNSDIPGSYQGFNKIITEDWQQFEQTFTISNTSNANKLSFWYLNAGVTYLLDGVEVYPENSIILNSLISYQTTEGFGAGIKRRTEQLYVLDPEIRENVESLAFNELEVNMIRFFVYHDLEISNDNENPFDLNTSVLDWTRYDSDPNKPRTRYVAEALSNAIDKSVNGFDYLIGNCNSAPPWLKTNGSHLNGGTLISGGEDEYSEFLIAFLKGMKARYDIDVNVISPSNEPDFQVTYESMDLTPEQLSSIIINLDSRLNTEELSNVKIMSPENFRVSPSNELSNNSATYYLNNMFTNPGVAEATDILATHTYQNPITSDDWMLFRNIDIDKSKWVTESGNLHSPDWDMNDAQYHIERIMNGFNFGNLSAYMFHLFYERHKYEYEVEEGDNYGSSALVLWDIDGNIILPKRYYIFKHFANLIKKGYKRIHINTIGNTFPNSLAFKSPEGNKIILHLFSQDNISELNIEIPEGTTTIEHFETSDITDKNFSYNEIDVTSNLLNVQLDAMSFHSYVFSNNSILNLTNSGSNSIIRPKISLWPNPTKKIVEVKLPNSENREINIYNVNGSQLFHIGDVTKEKIIIDISDFDNGMYYLVSKTSNYSETVKFLIQK